MCVCGSRSVTSHTYRGNNSWSSSIGAHRGSRRSRSDSRGCSNSSFQTGEEGSASRQRSTHPGSKSSLTVLYAGRYQRGEGEKHASTRRKEGRGGERREGRGRESNGDVYRTGVFSSAASYFPPSLPSFPWRLFPLWIWLGVLLIPYMKLQCKKRGYRVP